MSNRTRLKHARRVGTALVAGAASLIVPVAAQASAVNLGTTKPFVVLGATTVTNTGPSVLNGELGLSPGTSLTGFGFPAVVNGATHNNDAVAANAQSDLATAYNVAAGQPVPPGNVMTGLDLGGRTLAAGNYQYATSAQLTGQLTLDAAGDPSAQWVFKIGSTLTTASASSIILVNGASPCNVFWQVGSSATIDTTTAFKGNVLALTDITLNDAATSSTTRCATRRRRRPRRRPPTPQGPQAHPARHRQPERLALRAPSSRRPAGRRSRPSPTTARPSCCARRTPRGPARTASTPP
jgi:hypothetical protein